MSNRDSIGFRARHLLVALVVVGLAGAAAGAGTFALFNDVESSSDNSVQAGTMDLKINDSGSIEWTVGQNMPDSEAGVPGDGGDVQNIHVYNLGSVEADHVEIEVSNREFEDSGDTPGVHTPGPESDTMNTSAEGMAKYIEVTKFTYGGSHELVADGVLVDANGNGYVDLADLANETNDAALDDLPAPAKNGEGFYTLNVEIQMHSSMPNAYQGDITNTTVTFALHQEQGQDIEETSS